MAVKTHELENPERAAAPIETRESAPAPSSEILRRRRIASLKASTPADPAPHSGAAYFQGWQAGLDAAMESGKAAPPPERPAATACGDCFSRGWRAANLALEAQA